MENIKYKVDNFNEESNYVGNVNLPKPPKVGEYMYCQLCGEKILPSEISKDAKKRKRELKWHIHDKCYSSVSSKLDMLTPGLITHRYGNSNTDTLHKMVAREMEKNNKCTK